MKRNEHKFALFIRHTENNTESLNLCSIPHECHTNVVLHCIMHYILYTIAKSSGALVLLFQHCLDQKEAQRHCELSTFPDSGVLLSAVMEVAVLLNCVLQSEDFREVCH